MKVLFSDITKSGSQENKVTDPIKDRTDDLMVSF